MANYFVSFTLPDVFEPSFMIRIPEQRAFVDDLLAKGTITSYFLSLDRSQLWATFQATNQQVVERCIQSFPIREYISYEIIELTFYHSAAQQMPAISLN